MEDDDLLRLLISKVDDLNQKIDEAKDEEEYNYD